ncbi:MAG: hypothetical protein M1837_006569 [Sclerophora amabilis]|nr:MAG: hypothetical protein M1837_006569 [Sclerophora amabilis]
MALPPEVEASYAAIIDSILAESDIKTISINRVRKGLQAQIQYDITPQKALIKELIMSRFDKLDADKLATPLSPKQTPAKPSTNGRVHQIKNEPQAPEQQTSPHNNEPSTPRQQASPPTSGTRNEDEDEGEDSIPEPAAVSAKPPKKRLKTESLDADAQFAAKLQAEENSRARPTRLGVTKKPSSAKKKRSPIKTKSKVKVDEDSDVESGTGGEPKRKVNRSGGFHKPLILSPQLSELLGETALSRPETVKRIWAYVRERDLQDPNDKRQIRCDEPLRTVFKSDRVHMFTMNKILCGHLFAADE